MLTERITLLMLLLLLNHGRIDVNRVILGKLYFNVVRIVVATEEMVMHQAPAAHRPGIPWRMVGLERAE